MGTDFRPNRAEIATDARELLASGAVSRDAARDGLVRIVEDLRARLDCHEHEPCPLIQLIRELDEPG
jgi:hypothetical protein